MKVLLLSIGVLVLIATSLMVWLGRASSTALLSSEGSLGDLEHYLDALAETRSEDAFLIIQVAGTEDFIQFKRYEGTYEIDFPLVTERQRSLEPRIREAGRRLNLPGRTTRASSGDRFIDFDFKGTAKDAAVVVQSLLQRIFETDNAAKLKFQWSEIDVLAS